MAAARTETGTRKNPASVVAPSVSLFLSPSGEQPPTGEKTVMASQLGTIPITRLIPLLLRQRDVLIETGLTRRTLYQYMKDGLFPFPVMVGPKTVRWTSTSILAYQGGLQPTWDTSKGQGQEPGVVNYPAGTSRPLGSNKLLETVECTVTITLTSGEGTVATTWPFPGLIREKEVIRILAWSRGSLKRAAIAGLFPYPVRMGPRTIGWQLKPILTYVHNLPPAWHACHDIDRPHPLVDCPATGRTSKRNSAIEVARKTVPHVHSEAA